jgi:hypothetical protein
MPPTLIRLTGMPPATQTAAETLNQVADRRLVQALLQGPLG